MLTDSATRRNLSCIGCGSPRAIQGQAPPPYQMAPLPVRPAASPRFASSPNFQSSFPPVSPSHSAPFSFPSTPQSSSFHPPPGTHLLAAQAKSSHPLLTPSGRAFAVDGKVQNISSDPLSPCIMYWPDNEPFPDQGQIRPGNLGAPVRGVVSVPWAQLNDIYAAASHPQHR